MPDGYPLSFAGADDALSYEHATKVCEQVHLPFRTREPRGIIYSHASTDGRFYLLVYLRRGLLNVVARDNRAERELELTSGGRVDDGELHTLDIQCEPNALHAYVDQVGKQTNTF